MNRRIDDKEKIALSQEQIDFLKDLQKEINEQDTLATANPRIWVIIDYKRMPTSDDYASGYEIFESNFGETLTEEDVDEMIKEHIEENGENSIHEKILRNNSLGIGMAIPSNVKQWPIEIKMELLNEQGNDLILIPYSDIRFISEKSGSFLTNKAAKEHLASNKHHYTKKAHTYCLSGWRNPQMRQLVEILESTNWNLYRDKTEKRGLEI